MARFEAETNRKREMPLEGVEMGNDTVEMADLMTGIEAEKFANEVLTIEVQKTSVQGELPYAPVSVNAVNLYIPRGVKAKVKRKYVEALARGRSPRYDQVQVDPRDPFSQKLQEYDALTYPFSVIHDPNPKGAEWLKRVLQS